MKKYLCWDEDKIDDGAACVEHQSPKDAAEEYVYDRYRCIATLRISVLNPATGKVCRFDVDMDRDHDTKAHRADGAAA